MGERADKWVRERFNNDLYMLPTERELLSIIDELEEEIKILKSNSDTWVSPVEKFAGQFSGSNGGEHY